MTIAATPRPAPRPAARPVLLDPDELDETSAAEDDAAACPAVAPVAALVGFPPPFVPVAVVDVDIVLEDITDVAAAVDAPVSVFWFVKADVLKVLVSDCIPGQDVLPMTVTVVGCEAPSLTASFPETQSQFGSPGQQYQSSPLEFVHLARGIEVLLSAGVVVRLPIDRNHSQGLTLCKTPPRALLRIPCSICTST